MEEAMDHAELVAQFCGITGAAAAVAEQYLEAMSGDLAKAIDFFMDHPPNDMPEEPAGRTAAPAAQPDAIEIPDDDDDEPAELAAQRASALAARRHAQQQQEEELARLQQAFRPDAAGLAVQGAGLGAAAAEVGLAPAAQPADLPGLMDVGDDDAAAIAAAMAEDEGGQGLGAGGGGYSSYHHQQQQELLAHYRAQAEQQQLRALQQEQLGGGAGGSGGGNGNADAAAAAAAAAGSGAGLGPGAAAGAGAGGMPLLDPPLDLPDGINIEEARMLEAALLGIPYEGRLPDFTAGGGRAAGPPLSPGALEQRSLRAEQDAAYEESLALDRAKQASVAAAAAAAEAAARAEAEAAEAAAAAEQRAAQELAALLAAKVARLPPEPGSGEAGVLKLVVRLPDGSRKGRRFRPQDALQALFDYVDVECSGGGSGSAIGGGGGGGGAGGAAAALAPGRYRLVTQFPRRVLLEGGGDSLAAAGIESDTALFVELL